MAGTAAPPPPGAMRPLPHLLLLLLLLSAHLAQPQVPPLEPKFPGPVGDGQGELTWNLGGQVPSPAGPAQAPPPHLGLTWARRRRHSPHFPLCSFCCGCCRNRGCGFCCRT